jgi:esterase/lipase superfamily enzyme
VSEISLLNTSDGVPLFKSIILAAPDIDKRLFVSASDSMKAVARRLTLYASSKDKALIASREVHGYPRAGEAGDSLVVIEGMETIDASAVDTSFLNHSYYGDTRSIITDLFELIRHGLPADERAELRKRYLNGHAYWEVKP